LFFFQKMLAGGMAESIAWMRSYLAKLGLTWNCELISRLDVHTDAGCRFAEFKRRIDKGCCVTGRMRRNRKIQKGPTCIYFGSVGHFKLRVYDKGREQGASVKAWTRVEFELRREWLRRQGIETWSDVDMPSLWRTLTQRFRIVDSRPDGHHYERCPTWDVWQSIQDAATSFVERSGN